MPIHYLPYKEINKLKWDQCIKQSANKLIYAETVYLDQMATNWDGIILNDYEAVMPLPWRIKFGIKYLYQPAFIQQGGIYSKDQVDSNTIKEFLQLAMIHFKFAEIALNYSNKLEIFSDIFIQRERNNFILSIEDTYNNIAAKYKNSLLGKIKRLSKFNLKYITSENYHEIIQLFRQLYKERVRLNDIDYTNFENLCNILSKENRLVIRQVSTSNGELLAGVLMIKDNNRIINLMPCITNHGKMKYANYFLFNSLIEEFSNQGMLIDFEGSDISGIEIFYKNFTEENQTYTFIKWNNLPFPINIFKR